MGRVGGLFFFCVFSLFAVGPPQLFVFGGGGGGGGERTQQRLMEECDEDGQAQILLVSRLICLLNR